MSEKSHNQQIHDVTVQLEIVPENAQREDVADIDEVARSIVDHIRISGYTVKPKYTGKMGGPVFDIFVQAYAILHDNKELLSTAAAALEFISATLELIKGYIEQDGKDRNQPALVPTQIEITISTMNGPWIIKASDAEAAINVVKQLPIAEPEKVKTIALDNAKIKTSVARRRHKRHY